MWVRSIAWAALDRNVLDCEVCARSLIIALEVPRRKSETMAARATRALRAYETCARSQVLHSIVALRAWCRHTWSCLLGAMHSITPSALVCTSRGLIPSLLKSTPLSHILHQGPTTHKNTKTTQKHYKLTKLRGPNKHYLALIKYPQTYILQVP